MREIEEIEREITFDTPPGFELPDLRRTTVRTQRLPAEEFTTVYVDTADGRLWAQGVTLRHRTSGTEAEGTWTLAADDGGPPGPARWERSWPGAQDDVPAAAVSGVRGLTRRAPLQRVAVVRTVRQRLVLRDDKRVTAELDDDRMAVVGGRRDGLCLRRIELELGPGSGSLAERVVAEMVRAGAAPGADATFARVADVELVAGTDVVLGRRSSIDDVVRAAVTDGLRRLLDGDWRLRMAMPEVGADDVHHTRVATRRLRSHLKILGDALDPVWLTHVRDDLGWWGSVLGDVRDADVLQAHFTEVHAPAELIEDLGRQRRDALKRLVAALGSNRYVDLLDRLHAAGATPPFWPGSSGWRAGQKGATVLPELASRRYRAVRRRVRRAGKKPTDRELHRIRIKAKQLRYLAELATPVVGKPAERTASAAQALQTVLGTHRDAVAAEAWLQGWADRTASAAALPPAVLVQAGRLAADEHRRQRRLRRRWPAAWSELERRRSRRWLR